MKVAAAALLALAAGCAGYGSAADYRWTLEVPETVDPGADLEFRVRAFGPEDVEATGFPYRFSVVWPGGPTDVIPRSGQSGEEPKRVRARLASGKARLLIHAQDGEEKWIKVAEAAFSVN